LERRFRPEEIFAHQNIVDLGNEQYGIEAASQYYFGVPAARLSLADAALLAGMIRAPNNLSPSTHPDHALGRRNEVLDRMQ
jgi:membrane peptidoglycan carboxypeptidase